MRDTCGDRGDVVIAVVGGTSGKRGDCGCERDDRGGVNVDRDGDRGDRGGVIGVSGGRSGHGSVCV